MKLVGHLKKPPQLFFRLNAATVAPCLDPNDPIAVEVGFIQTFRNSEGNDNAARAYFYVFGCRRDRMGVTS